MVPAAPTPSPTSRAAGLALAAALLVPCVARPAAASALEGSLAAATQSARQAASSVGVHVVDLSSGDTVYAFDADQARIIASNTKLVTSAAALDALGPGYLFETELLYHGRRDGGVLQGDLAVLGGGDPNISGRHHEGDPLAVFRRWAADLRALGIARVEGDVYLVHGLFEPPLVHPDWPRDQLSRWYEAPVGALSFNDNCVLVRVWPGGGVGRPAQVETIPDLALFEVENRAATTSSARRHVVAIERNGVANTLSVRGSVFSRARPVESWVTVADPAEYFGAALRRGFAEGGVEVAGEMRPVEALPVGTWARGAVHRSDLLTTLEVVNKRSQNFYAESLVKLLGAERCGRGSWETGLGVLEEFLGRVGIESGYNLADGSGMSRNNRFSARQLTTLLQHMFFHPLAPEYLRSLPFSGERGAQWEKRLETAPYRGNVFAKTGYLRGVSTLSGYAKGRSGRVYAFSILSNNTRNVWGAKRAQDRIVRALVDQG